MKDSIIAKIILSLIIFGFLGLGFSGYNNIDPEAKLIQVDDIAIYKSDFQELNNAALVCNMINPFFQTIFQTDPAAEANLQQVLVMAILTDKLNKQEFFFTEEDKATYRSQAISHILSGNIRDNQNRALSVLMNSNKRNVIGAIDKCQIFDVFFQQAYKEQNIVNNSKYRLILNRYYTQDYDLDYIVLNNPDSAHEYAIDEEQTRAFYRKYKKQIKKLVFSKVEFIEIASDTTDTQNAEDAFLQKIQDIQIMLDQNTSIQEIANTLQKTTEEEMILHASSALQDMNIITLPQTDAADTWQKINFIKLPQQKIPTAVIKKVIDHHKITQSSLDDTSVILVPNQEQTKYWLVKYIPKPHQVTGESDTVIDKLRHLQQLNTQTEKYSEGLLAKLQNNETNWKNLSQTQRQEKINRHEITRQIIIQKNLGQGSINSDPDKKKLNHYLNQEQIMGVMRDIDLAFLPNTPQPEEEQDTEKQNDADDQKKDDAKTQKEQELALKSQIANSPDRFVLMKTVQNNEQQILILHVNDIDINRHKEESEDSKIIASIIDFGFVYSFGQEFVQGLLHDYLPKITVYTDNISDLYKVKKENLEQLLNQIKTRQTQPAE